MLPQLHENIKEVKKATNDMQPIPWVFHTVSPSSDSIIGFVLFLILENCEKIKMVNLLREVSLTFSRPWSPVRDVFDVIIMGDVVFPVFKTGCYN